MSLINRLIREVRDGATELLIRPQDVGTVAEHVHALAWGPLTVEQARTYILKGDMRLEGVPIRVLGGQDAS